VARGSEADTIHRLWALMRHVPRAPRRIDTARLEKLLGEEGLVVTRRSIQRDLERLAARFTTLRCDDRDKPYAWYWDGGAPLVEIPGMGISAAVTFSMVEAYLATALPRSTVKSLEPHFARARQVIDGASSTKIAAWPRKVRVVPRGLPLKPPNVLPRVLDAVYTALLDDRCFKVVYRKRGTSEDREYEVNPLGLVVRDGTLALVCTYWEYDNVSHMLLHRMSRVDLLDRPARRPRGFDLDAHVAAGGATYAFGDPIALEATVDAIVAQTLSETPISKDQRLTPKGDERFELRATVPDTIELRGWLLGYGALVEVTKPDGLRDEIREKIGAMAERYGVK
jgi:WYL domain